MQPHKLERLQNTERCGQCYFVFNLRASSSGRYGDGERLQLRLWNLKSTSNSPVAPRRLSCQISANQREAETNANVNRHWKTRAYGNEVITNVISANQHFASTFDADIQIPETLFQFLLPFPSPPPELTGRLFCFKLIVLLYFSFSTYKNFNFEKVYGDHQLHLPLTGANCMWQNEVVNKLTH